MKTYIDTAFQFIKENKYITHKKIQQLTNCNDSYSVMQALKKRLEFQGITLFSKPDRNPKTKKMFTYYWIEVA